MKKRLQIKELKIQSFVTDLDVRKGIKGGTGFTLNTCETVTNCPSCPCSEAYTICCEGGDTFPTP